MADQNNTGTGDAALNEAKPFIRERAILAREADVKVKAAGGWEKMTEEQKAAFKKWEKEEVEKIEAKMKDVSKAAKEIYETKTAEGDALGKAVEELGTPLEAGIKEARDHAHDLAIAQKQYNEKIKAANGDSSKVEEAKTWLKGKREAIEGKTSKLSHEGRYAFLHLTEESNLSKAAENVAARNMLERVGSFASRHSGKTALAAAAATGAMMILGGKGKSPEPAADGSTPDDQKPKHSMLFRTGEVALGAVALIAAIEKVGGFAKGSLAKAAFSGVEGITRA